MRILFFLPDADAGGAQRTIVNLANTLSAAGSNVLLCVANLNGPARHWIADSVKVIDLASRHARHALFPLVSVIRTTRPDVLVASMIDANIVAWAAWGLCGKRRPRLVLRETNSHRARDDLAAWRRWLVGLAYRNADRVIALSEGVRSELIEDIGLAEDAIVTIHNPVDVEKFRQGARAAREAAPPWGAFGGDGLLLVAVGRLIPQKGFDLLLRAFAKSEQARKNGRLVIVGEGPERAQLVGLAQQLGIADRLLLPGFMTDPTAWYAHGDIFVLSSRWEGFGHVIVEAMACGLPVIAFDCPYGPADILAGGQAGILVSPENVDALAAAIDELMSASEKRAQLSLGAERVAEWFSQARIARQYENVLRSVTRGEMRCPN
jgi:glycosyltransferase involved in cell wall biosynthesis